MRLDLVLPAHNEEQRIDRTLHAYRAALPPEGTRIWVALDGCVDGTAAIVRRHASDDSRIGWVEFPKLGKGGVLMESFRWCADGDADLIAFVDADGATPPAELMRLIRTVEAGADAAIASRRHPSSVSLGQRSLARRLTSAGFAFGVRRLFGVPFSDTQCGAKVMSAQLVRRVAPFLSSRDFLFDVDILHTARHLGFGVVEVPTVWIDQAGSRLNAGSDARRMLWSSLRLWMHHRVIPVEGQRTDVVRRRSPMCDRGVSGIDLREHTVADVAS
ncbi:MAG: glycosyltransferase [Acidimicrobiia bacterium]|nr:glycosyltransferase [Acidimicrobiia bacterium]